MFKAEKVNESWDSHGGFRCRQCKETIRGGEIAYTELKGELKIAKWKCKKCFGEENLMRLAVQELSK